jgi:hypothetical protein
MVTVNLAKDTQIRDALLSTHQQLWQNHLCNVYATYVNNYRNYESRSYLEQNQVTQAYYDAIKTLSSSDINTNQDNFNWISATNPYHRVMHLKDLKDNWDGYGAPSFTDAHLIKAKDILDVIFKHVNKNISFEKARPFVAPCSDGSILFEWAGERYLKKNLEIYIYPSDNSPIEYLQSDIEEDKEHEGEIFPDSLGSLRKLLEWLFTD